MRTFFVTITCKGSLPLTLSMEAEGERALHDYLVTSYGDRASFAWSEHPEPRPPHVDDWEAEGRRIALEGMDLPDGAYLAMAEELGIGFD